MTTTAQPPPPPATDAHAATVPETLEIIYQVSKDSQAAAAAQISTLDTKASFVLGAASLLASGITGVQATVSGHTNRYYISGPDAHLAVTLTAAEAKPIDRRIRVATRPIDIVVGVRLLRHGRLRSQRDIS